MRHKKNTSWSRCALVCKPRLVGETKVFCIVPCGETGDRLVLAEDGVVKHLTQYNLLCSLDLSQ